MRMLSTLALTVVLYSCSLTTGSSNDQLLTAFKWSIEKGSIDGTMPQSTEYHTFLTDGTYQLESGDTKVNGKWNWTNDNEIFLQTEGVTINGQTNTFDKKSNGYIKVLELTEKTLKTMERGEGDSWDSGFAKERSYRAQSL